MSKASAYTFFGNLYFYLFNLWKCFCEDRNKIIIDWLIDSLTLYLLMDHQGKMICFQDPRKLSQIVS